MPGPGDGAQAGTSAHDHGDGPGRDVIVVANGDPAAAVLRSLVDGRPGATVIAADGGARSAMAAGILPAIVIGDGDSLPSLERDQLVADGVELRLAAPDKDESDTELCLLAAVAGGATRIAIVGALGGDRPEHAIANLLLLADPRFAAVELSIHAEATRITRIGGVGLPGRLDVSGAAGDHVSLLPVGGPVRCVRTTGLRFPLHAETLTLGPTRGLSNELIGTDARIETADGCLLIVVTARVASDPPADQGRDPR